MSRTRPTLALAGRSATVAGGLLAVVAAGGVVATTTTGATEVVDEAGLRAAVADPTETLVHLTADVALTDCAAGALTRTSATPLLVDGGGFRIRQTCPGERLLTLGHLAILANGRVVPRERKAIEEARLLLDLPADVLERIQREASG